MISNLLQTHTKSSFSVLDIGAMGGTRQFFPKFIEQERYIDFKNSNNVEFFGIEPNIKEVNKIKHQYKRILPVALYDQRGQHKMHMTKDGGGRSSLLSPDIEILKRNRLNKSMNLENFEVTEIFDINTEVLTKELFNKSTFDLVKIDVQGVEYQIIDGGREILRNSIGLIIETQKEQFYKNQKLEKDIDQLCANLGFRKVLSLKKKQIKGECDNVYINDSQINSSKDNVIKYLSILHIFYLDGELQNFIRSYSGNFLDDSEINSIYSELYKTRKQNFSQSYFNRFLSIFSR